ncbi:MAG: phosphatase PAP2 family protein [Stellaceae bacterium]
MRRAVAAYVAALVLAAAVFLLFPGIDLWASGLFYRAGDGFFLAQWAPVRALYAGVPYLTDVIVVGVIALYLWSLRRGRAVWRVDGRVAAFLLLALALGPGLLVNTVLKDHWGRARPSQVTQFGGTQAFTPAPLPAANCQRNCSFPAGHPAIGFYLVSFAFLVRDRRRRRAATGAAIAAGAVFGLARLAQGGHFLSDVVFSGLLVYGVSALLYRAIILDDRLARWLGAFAPPRALALPALLLLLALLLSIAFVDRPVARFFHDSDPSLRQVFQFITQFGLSKGYLVVTALLFVTFRLAAFGARDRQLAATLALQARRALFVCIAVAGAGIVADIVKLVFGRARPKLLFADGFYGFTWGAAQADYWSFPSGHATTVAALTVALYLLWPRGLAVYLVVALLVAASRIIITAHYVSDALMGAAIGGGVAWVVWRGFARTGPDLAGPVAQPPSGAPGSPKR